jgi:hypothetical protein
MKGYFLLLDKYHSVRHLPLQKRARAGWALLNFLPQNSQMLSFTPFMEDTSTYLIIRFPRGRSTHISRPFLHQTYMVKADTPSILAAFGADIYWSFLFFALFIAGA